MNIGFVGLGKLGLPCALVIASKGHKVCGYDVDEKIADYLKEKQIPYQEEGVPELLKTETVDFVSMEEVVGRSDIIFVAVQTPHEELYEGTTRLPDERVDFDYRFLVNAMTQISNIAAEKEKPITVVIISTVLPGTISRTIYPVISDYIDLMYNPFFIAMGTTVRDFFNPDIILIGDHYVRADDGIEKNILIDFYKTVINVPVLYKVMSIESAELTKVAYNTIITSKINIANTIMEICHKISYADVDEVTDALKDCHLRITSPRYMDGGMGDGGGCHPRDNIAMSWLSRKLNLSHDVYEDLMKTREAQTEWLADLIIEECKKVDLPPVLLGYAFKPETNITTGSPALLLEKIMEEKEFPFYAKHDPYYENFELIKRFVSRTPAVYFIGTQHLLFRQLSFKEKSVLIDPFRYMPYVVPQIKNIKYVYIGSHEAGTGIKDENYTSYL